VLTRGVASRWLTGHNTMPYDSAIESA